MSDTEQALRAEADRIGRTHPDILPPQDDRRVTGRRYLVVTFPDGDQLLLDLWADGTAAVATRSKRWHSWSPPVSVTVEEGVDG